MEGHLDALEGRTDNSKPEGRLFRRGRRCYGSGTLYHVILLMWLENGVAERRGLLGDYRSEYDSETLAKIPKCQRVFILI